MRVHDAVDQTMVVKINFKQTILLFNILKTLRFRCHGVCVAYGIFSTTLVDAP